jgi:DNA-binding beta-propeller fold protein YncE
VKVPVGSPTGGIAVLGTKAFIPAIAADYSNWPAIAYTFSGVYVVDTVTRQVEQTIALANDANPSDISLDPNGQIEVATKSGIVLIDPVTYATSVGAAFGEPVHSVRYASGTLAYAAISNGLVSFDPATQAVIKGVADKIPAGGDTSVGGFELRQGRAYVPNFANDTVTVVDLATLQVVGDPYHVGDGPQAVVFQAR